MYYTSVSWVYAGDISGFKLKLTFWQLVEEIQGEGVFQRSCIQYLWKIPGHSEFIAMISFLTLSYEVCTISIL